MVALVGGQLSMKNATFVDNFFEFLPSIVFLDEKSELNSNLDNCEYKNGGGENSPPQTCNGIFLQTEPGDCFNVDECVGECEKFTSQACVIDECYSDWKDLSLAIQTASLDEMGGTFELCSNTVFDLDEYPESKITPIVISEGGTVIRCGKDGNRDNDCVVQGGTQQFVVEGSPSKNVFVGVTFLSSRKTSISANGDSNADVTFIDCRWSNHTGSSVIEIYFEGIDQSDVSLSDIPAPRDTSMKVLLANCSVVGNALSYSSISNFNGIFYTEDTLFSANVAPGGAIISFFSGQVALTTTCFVDTRSNELPGSVFLQKTSLVLKNEKNFGAGNNSTNAANCAAIFTESDGSCVDDNRCDGECLEFTAELCEATDFDGESTLPSSAPSLSSSSETPTAPPVTDSSSEIPTALPVTDSDMPSSTSSPVSDLPPTSSPSIPKVESEMPSSSPRPSSNGCFTKWDALSEAVGAASSSGEGETFIICPNTVMNVDFFPDRDITPIIVGADEIVVQCGSDGVADNNCLIFGGRSHFSIVESAARVEFRGLKFVGATENSINALGKSSASATFFDCTFSRSQGTAAIFLYGGSLEDSLDDDAALLEKQGEAMSLEIVNCTFSDNDVDMAPVVNAGGEVTVENTVFRGNEGEVGAIVVLASGSLSVTESCFLSNTATVGAGAILVEVNSTLVVAEGNFGSGNKALGDSSCMEILVLDVDNEKCISFDSEDCLVSDLPPTPSPSIPKVDSEMPSSSPRPSSNGCFTKWDALSEAVGAASSSGEGETFIICPNTVMNVDFFPDRDITPIIVGADEIVVQCGSDGVADNNCLIFGGRSHFSIVESAARVEFRGLKFVGATENSINALGKSSASATFFDCTFSRSQGTAAIFLYGGSLEDSLDDDAALLEKQGEAMSLEIVNCTFSDNDVDMAPVVNAGGEVTVENTVFRGNEGEVGAIVVLASGSLSVTESCFLSNTATVGAGAILVEVNSTLVVAEGNFGSGNKALGDSSCMEILVLDVDNEKCISFDSEDCLVSDLPPTSSPTISNITSIVPSSKPSSAIPSVLPLECFTEWDTLSKAIRAASKADTSGTFTLCEDSFFDVSAFPETSISPIVISSSDITVQCGDLGEQASNCTVSGGVNQFMIRGTVSNVTFAGISFMASMGISVHAAGTENSNAAFVDCKWEANEGTSAVLILQVTASRAITKSMAVEILNSNFTDNDVLEAAILNVGGELVVDQTLFLRNKGGKGAIGVSDEGELSVTGSCFVNNAGSGEDATGGDITLQNNSSLSINENNFAVGNEGCGGILTTDDENDLICGRACTVFTAKECAVVDIPVGEFPTASPSETQTLPPLCFESDVPTTSPNPTVTMEPTTSAPSSTKNPTSLFSEPTTSPAPSMTENTNQTVAPSATASSSNPTSLVAPTSALSPTQMFSVSATPTTTGKPTSSAAPSGTPKPSTTSLSTVPTTVQSQAPLTTSTITPSSSTPNTGPTTVSESPTALETEMPMSMSFSYDYFFYK